MVTVKQKQHASGLKIYPNLHLPILSKVESKGYGKWLLVQTGVRKEAEPYL